jgi:hypothetical protein
MASDTRTHTVLPRTARYAGDPAIGQLLHRQNARATIRGKLFAPYAVWLDLPAPDADGGDERAAAQLPEAISDLIAAGWEVTAPTLDSEDDNPDESEDDPPDLLDVRVLAHPSGAFVGLASTPRWLRSRSPSTPAWPATSPWPHPHCWDDPRLDPHRDPHRPMRRFTYEVPVRFGSWTLDKSQLPHRQLLRPVFDLSHSYPYETGG